MDEAVINRWFWIVIAVTAVLLLGIGVDFFFVYKKHESLVQEKSQKEEELTKLQSRFAYLKKKERLMLANKEEAKRYEAYLPSEDDIPGMLETIATLATDNNLLLNFATVSKPKAQTSSRKKKKELYESRIFNFRLVGHYPDIIKFVNQVENLDRFVMVNDAKLTPLSEGELAKKEGEKFDPSRPPYISFTIMIYTFVYTGD
ncbi:MAG: hypothetical protein DRP90_00140 [Planctomycetota bacterium]|nr:MAG: hypothetical protein DRP90_00140 [Planctomycetota bacterium]